MRTILALMVLVGCLAGPAGAVEEPILFRFQGVGVTDDLIDAAMMLFSGSLVEEGTYQPVSATDVLGYVECYEAACAATHGREAGFDKAIVGSLTRLGDKIIVRVQLVDTRDGAVIVSEKGTSDTEEDLDVVLSRLAKSITTGKEFDRTVEVGTVTEKEASESKRRKSDSSKGLRVGFLWPTNDSFGNNVDRLIALDFAYQYDMPDFFLMGRSGLRWGDESVDVCFLDVKIGRYLGRGDFTPFLNGGLGVHYIRGKGTFSVTDAQGTRIETWDDGSYGLVFLGGAGVTAFRTYNFQFQIDVDYFVMLDEINEDGPVGSEARRPQGLLFTFCIRKSS